MITKTDTCILENKNEWIEYVAIHAPGTLYEAESLYALSMIPNITKEFIAKMLCEYGGDVRFFSKIITVGMNEYNKN
ncbi:hypothetical protein KA005_73140, partial [bacterium]|nr:hypothetical protein [bacterium]